MSVMRAVKHGDFHDPTVWDIGRVPSIEFYDQVAAAGYNITITKSLDVYDLHTDSFNGWPAGGSFTVAAGINPITIQYSYLYSHSTTCLTVVERALFHHHTVICRGFSRGGFTTDAKGLLIGNGNVYYGNSVSNAPSGVNLANGVAVFNGAIQYGDSQSANVDTFAFSSGTLLYNGGIQYGTSRNLGSAANTATTAYAGGVHIGDSIGGNGNESYGTMVVNGGIHIGNCTGGGHIGAYGTYANSGGVVITTSLLTAGTAPALLLNYGSWHYWYDGADITSRISNTDASWYNAVDGYAPWPTGPTVVESYNAAMGLGSHTSSDLAACWLLQEKSGTFVTDRSGNNLSGTATATISDRVGPNDYLTSAIDFPGTMIINFGNPSQLRITSNLTLVCWVRNDNAAAATNVGIMAKYVGTPNANRGYLLAFDHQNSAASSINGALSPDGNSSLMNNVQGESTGTGWNHLALTYKPSELIRLMKNGQPSASLITGVVANIFNTPADFVLGGLFDYSNSTYMLNGGMAEAAIFYKTLTIDEIAQISRGPEPINIIAAQLSNTGEVTNGVWALPFPFDSRSNGPITVRVTLKNAANDRIVISTTTPNPDLSSYVTQNESYYILEEASNLGGIDPAATTRSANVTMGGGNTIIPPYVLTMNMVGV